MLTTLGINHMSSQRADIAELTMFQTAQIAVASQRDIRPVNRLDAVYNEVVAVNPSQYDMPHFQVLGFLQDDAFLTPNNEWQHALSVDGQRYADTIAHQSAGFFNNHMISHHNYTLLIVPQHNCAAASSGRHSRCQTGTVMASAFSVWCNPSAIRSSQRLPLMLGTRAT